MKIPKRLNSEVKDNLILASNAIFDPQRKKPVTTVIDLNSKTD